METIVWGISTFLQVFLITLPASLQLLFELSFARSHQLMCLKKLKFTRGLQFPERSVAVTKIPGRNAEGRMGRWMEGRKEG